MVRHPSGTADACFDYSFFHLVSECDSRGACCCCRCAQSSSGECECGEGGFADINGTKVSGALLRGLSLSNAAGETKVLSDVIGSEGKAVIVYLRHLG